MGLSDLMEKALGSLLCREKSFGENKKNNNEQVAAGIKKPRKLLISQNSLQYISP